MDITIKTTISKLDQTTYEIRSECVVGEKTIRRSEAYDATMLLESRFLTGTLDERLETMRQAAEKVTEKEIRAVVAHMQATRQQVVATTGTLGQVAKAVAERSAPEAEEPVVPAKKTRKARTTKKQNTQTPSENQE